MSDMAQVIGPETLRIERILPGPIERVWDYLTDSDKRAKWLAGGAMELRLNGKVELAFRNSKLSAPDDLPPEKFAGQGENASMIGRVTVCDPPSLLRYLWGEADDAPEVTFELSPRGDKVQLVLTQVRTADRGMQINMAAGWHTHLAILAAELSNETPPSFWALFVSLEAQYKKLIPNL